MIDKATLEGVRNREEAAFKLMYESSLRYVYAIVQRYVTNESDYKDVVQEIFARLFLSIASFDEKKGDFKFWLRRLAINQCFKHYHKIKENVKILSLDIESNEEPSEDVNLDGLTTEELQLFLKGMPDGYKSVFSLVVIDDYTPQEVSKLLNISAETSRSQLHRAKKWLKANLSSPYLEALVGK